MKVHALGQGGSPGSGGDVDGPASAVDGHLAVFDGVTGKIIKDGGAVPAGATGADPTGTVGLATVNGAAATFLRSDGAPALSQAIVPTWTGSHVFAKAGAASLPAMMFTGAILTGGTGTTNFPHIFIQPTGTTAQTNWNTGGTVIGVNLANGYAGDFIKCQTVGNTNLFVVAASGAVTCTVSLSGPSSGVWNSSGLAVGSGSQYLAWINSTIMTAATNGTVLFTNNAATAGFTMRFTTDNNFEVRNRANSGAGDIICGNITASASLTVTTSISLGAAQDITFSGRARLRSPADSKIKIVNNGGTTGVTLDVSTDGKMTVRNFADAADGIIQGSNVIASGVFKLPAYTVGTLPAGAAGDRAYVSDATAPVYNTGLTGGGAVLVPVFKNATVWVSA